MGTEEWPFIGTEALATGELSRHELRTYYRAIMPDVYLAKRAQPSLRQRTAGAAASAMHGSKWIDDDAPIELIWRNARAPQGVITRDDRLSDSEFQRRAGLCVTTPERTAFDLGRRGSLVRAVAGLDALAVATDFKIRDVHELAVGHRHTRGLRQLEIALNLVDAGAQSPKETWLRLLLVGSGFPRPQTQIVVRGADGFPRYFLDMGWEDLKLAVEYDGGQHWTDPTQYESDVTRQEYLNKIGWTVVRVVSRHRASDVIRRVDPPGMN